MTNYIGIYNQLIKLCNLITSDIIGVQKNQEVYSSEI